MHTVLKKKSLLTSILFIAALALFSGAAAGNLLNPYAQIDWQTYEQHKANLHTHTTQSDGGGNPDEIIDLYHQRGYTILAITDHNLCTWPWQNWGKDPAALGMLAIPGNEASRHHHLNSFFIEFETDSSNAEQSFEEIGAAGGLAQINHPGRYWEPTNEGAIPDGVVDGYVNWLNAYSHIVGVEVVNSFNRYPHDRQLWDALLTAMMPEHPVWGFANDDLHYLILIGLSWTTFLLPELSETALREAMINGEFYFSTAATHVPQDPAQTPIINAIAHDQVGGVITIDADSGGAPLPQTDYHWISEGNLIHVGPSLAYRETPGVGVYVRAELIGQGGTTYTNPFGVSSIGATSLTVEIHPVEAVFAGAKWRVDDSSVWRDSGDEITIAPGNHVVHFKRINGWTPPASMVVSIAPGESAVVAEADGAVYAYTPGVVLPLSKWSTAALVMLVLAVASMVFVRARSAAV